MTNQNNSKRTIRSMVTLATLIVSLTLLSLPMGNQAKNDLNVAPAPVDTCIAQAFVKIEKVLYQDRINGQDVIHVEWSNHADSSCVWFGGGFDVPGKSDVPPFGQEVTVKIKRRGGHEDVGTSKSSSVIAANNVVSNNVHIPRGTLETDPVSFEVKVRTTAGVVMTTTARLSGNGAPTLTGVTQVFNHHATVPNLAGTCFPSIQVSALDFFPGAGPKPDRVTISLTTGFPPTAESCFDAPKVTIRVRATRSNGVVDTGQANVAAGNTTTTISLSGTPGTVASFEIIVSATAGSVIEKSSISTGAF